MEDYVLQIRPSIRSGGFCRSLGDFTGEMVEAEILVGIRDSFDRKFLLPILADSKIRKTYRRLL
jgi:hypothetical protein